MTVYEMAMRIRSRDQSFKPPDWFEKVISIFLNTYNLSDPTEREIASGIDDAVLPDAAEPHRRTILTNFTVMGQNMKPLPGLFFSVPAQGQRTRPGIDTQHGAGDIDQRLDRI